MEGGLQPHLAPSATQEPAIKDGGYSSRSQRSGEFMNEGLSPRNLVEPEREIRWQGMTSLEQTESYPAGSQKKDKKINEIILFKFAANFI